MTTALEHAADLGAFIAASPSSFHAAAEGARRLTAAGFVQQDETAPFDPAPGGHLVIRDGTLLAWRIPRGLRPGTGFRIIGTHTDSPGFQLKPRPTVSSTGWQQVGMEIYGGPLLNSWLDRELGLAGRLVLADGTVRLVRTGPIMRIPQLAIHLDRAVNEEGVKLDRQFQTTPIWSVGRPDVDILDYLAGLVGARRHEIDGFDVMAYDTAAPVVFGPHEEFLAAGRLDNLASVHAGLTAMIDSGPGDAVPVLVAFDHEEIGSGSRSGAAGPVLESLLQRISVSSGGDAEDHLRAVAASACVSSDTGHAVHPNYASRHDPAHHPLLNGGPLLKINANQRYATDAVSAAMWRRCCRRVGVGVQEFVSHNAMPCGSTIGPPLLSMHSARELAGVADQQALARALTAFLGGV